MDNNEFKSFLKEEVRKQIEISNKYGHLTTEECDKEIASMLKQPNLREGLGQDVLKFLARRTSGGVRKWLATRIVSWYGVPSGHFLNKTIVEHVMGLSNEQIEGLLQGEQSMRTKFADVIANDVVAAFKDRIYYVMGLDENSSLGNVLSSAMAEAIHGEKFKQAVKEAMMNTLVSFDVEDVVPEAPETPEEASEETPVEAPIEEPIEAPIETPIETPIEAPEETPVEVPPVVTGTPEGPQPEGPAEAPVVPVPEQPATSDRAATKEAAKPLRDEMKEFLRGIAGGGQIQWNNGNKTLFTSLSNPEVINALYGKFSEAETEEDKIRVFLDHEGTNLITSAGKGFLEAHLNPDDAEEKVQDISDELEENPGDPEVQDKAVGGAAEIATDDDNSPVVRADALDIATDGIDPQDQEGDQNEETISLDDTSQELQGVSSDLETGEGEEQDEEPSTEPLKRRKKRRRREPDPAQGSLFGSPEGELEEVVQISYNLMKELLK